MGESAAEPSLRGRIIGWLLLVVFCALLGLTCATFTEKSVASYLIAAAYFYYTALVIGLAYVRHLLYFKKDNFLFRWIVHFCIEVSNMKSIHVAAIMVAICLVLGTLYVNLALSQF